MGDHHQKWEGEHPHKDFSIHFWDVHQGYLALTHIHITVKQHVLGPHIAPSDDLQAAELHPQSGTPRCFALQTNGEDLAEAGKRMGKWWRAVGIWWKIIGKWWKIMGNGGKSMENGGKPWENCDLTMEIMNN